MLRLKDLREDTDLKQKDIANILNISQTNYSKYELNKINIPTNILVILAYFYDTSIEDILGLTDIKEPYTKTKENMDLQKYFKKFKK